MRMVTAPKIDHDTVLTTNLLDEWRNGRVLIAYSAGDVYVARSVSDSEWAFVRLGDPRDTFLRTNGLVTFVNRITPTKECRYYLFDSAQELLDRWPT